MEEIRLQKYISDCGIMSRRAAEEEMMRGHITVNGIRAEPGQKIDPAVDEVVWKGKPIRKSSTAKYTVVMLNKPRGYLTAMSDDRGRPCVSDLVADVGCRVYPCGRLDLDSEGLLLLTNDGELANRLTHPSYHIPKIYHVRVAAEVTPEQIKTLSRPMEIDGYRTKPAQVDIVTRKPDYSVLAFTLHEGRNRQIRKMCEQVGLRVVTLKRIAVGNIKLGLLKSGMWKKLTADQVAYLRTSVSLKRST